VDLPYCLMSDEELDTKIALAKDKCNDILKLEQQKREEEEKFEA